jgi:sugar phosphate isomerase/epimerase
LARTVDRRDFLLSAAAGAASALAAPLPGAAAIKFDRAATQPTLGFSTYGLPGTTTEEALPLLAQIGFDNVELDARPDGDAAPARMTPRRRDIVRQGLAETGLRLTSLMVEQYPTPDAGRHAPVLEHLRAAADLGHALAPDRPPLIQTTLGGGAWEEVRPWFVERLADWVRVADETETVIAIKPHRGGAMSRPADAAWLIEQLGHPPRLRMVYDFSHYAFRDMPLDQTVATALPILAHVAVKDAAQEAGKVVFDLPGQRGTIDYPRLLRLLADGGYRGDICCEVSRMLWSQPGYDGPAAARTCHANMRRALDQAGLATTGGSSPLKNAS